MASVFLTAQWRNLINLTYEVPVEILVPYTPKGLEIDTQLNGKAHVSFVAFDFLDTRVKGIKIPFHVNFPEINLRFYVRHQGEVGVVFIREFVPKFWIAWVANVIYNEPYKAIPMVSKTTVNASEIYVEHHFSVNQQKFSVKANAQNAPFFPDKTSVEHYFKEHTWGFGATKSGKTLRYEVEHPIWRIYPLHNYELEVDFGSIYGNQWSFLNHTQPQYALLAEGSAIKVFGARDL
jgi:uncharacterized protein YqjF (DUF2071 family)